jgi:hypothetical protein
MQKSIKLRLMVQYGIICTIDIKAQLIKQSFVGYDSIFT